jgi:hypothetical protein
MSNDISGPAWFKIGGVLTGIAALITAVVTAVATFVDLWPDGPNQLDEAAVNRSPYTPSPAIPSSTKRLTSHIALESPDDHPSTELNDTSSTSRAVPTESVYLVRYAGDGCFYAVEVLEAREDGYRVRFPFGLATMVPPSDVRAARHQPSDLQLGAVVFVTAKRTTAHAESYDFYKAATIEDILGSTVHARFKQESVCPVGRTLVALPASNVLVDIR